MTLSRRSTSRSAAGGGVEREAAEWWLRRSQGLAGEDRHRLARWLAADPAHGAALARLDEVSRTLDGLPPERVAALRRSVDHAGRTRPGRRLSQMALAAVVALAVAGGSWLAVDAVLQQPTYSQQLATARGHQSRYTLPDGSELQLDAASEAHVTLYRDRREVRLASGQAMFAVQPDTARPFHVLAGRNRITVVGTRFSVRHVGPEVAVAVEQGRVRVAAEHDSAAAVPGGVELTAGQAVVADSSGALAAVTPIGPGAVAPWREGRLVFDDTPLASALAEFARYGDTHLVIRDPAVGALRVTGSFEIAQVGKFVRALPLILPVRLASRDGRTEIQAR